MLEVYHYNHVYRAAYKDGQHVAPYIPNQTTPLEGGRGFLAFFQPEPDAWVNNQNFPRAWDRIIFQNAPILFSALVDPYDRGVCVVDWGHAEGHLESVDPAVFGRLPERYRHTTEQSFIDAYQKSKIWLMQYLVAEGSLQYELPRVFIAHEVPAERVSVPSTQPILEALYAEGAEDRTRLLSGLPEWLALVPQLGCWGEGFFGADSNVWREVKRQAEYLGR